MKIYILLETDKGVAICYNDDDMPFNVYKTVPDFPAFKTVELAQTMLEGVKAQGRS